MLSFELIAIKAVLDKYEDRLNKENQMPDLGTLVEIEKEIKCFIEHILDFSRENNQLEVIKNLLREKNNG